MIIGLLLGNRTVFVSGMAVLRWGTSIAVWLVFGSCVESIEGSGVDRLGGAYW